MKKISNPNCWYKTHPNDPTPTTTTHDMMVEGSKAPAKDQPLQKQISFQTYPMNDIRFDLLSHPNQMRLAMITNYNREFKRPYGYVPRPFKNPHDKPSPDVLFNRLPVNQFGLYPYASTKFMDDHMFEMSEARKKINFFRQMRNTHYPIKTEDDCS